MGMSIGPKIGIEGEAEFRKQIRNINDEYKTLEAETKMVAAQFDALGDEQGKLEAESKQLIKQIEKQQDKMELLEDAVKKASDKYGENSTEANRLKGALYDTQTTITNLESKLRSATAQLDDMASELDDVEDAAKDAGDALGDAGDDALSFGDVLGADMISDAIGSIAESIGEAAEESKEYRRIMASLEESSKDAGYSAGETAELFGKLNGVLGDDQAAATTTANLQALEIEQEKLQSLTNGVIGSWAKYGDSIPIDGLGEAVNHTAKLGEVQGVLADVLEWGGISVDEFNAQLAACTDTTERADLIAQMFADQGLTAMGEGWQKNNASLIESNQAAANFQEQIARLGEAAEPIFTKVTKLATGMLSVINDGIEELTRKTAGAELSAGMDSFTAAMNKAATATATTTAEVESSAYIAQGYVQRLKDLEDGGLDTAEAQREYASTVELMNELIPELNLSIDETTGILKQGTIRILENIDAWKQRATQQAFQKQLTTEIEAQADAQAALYAAEAKQIELAAKEEDILRRIAEAQAKVAKETAGTSGSMDKLANAMQIGMVASSGLTGDYLDLANQAMGVTDEIAALEEELYRNRSEQSELNVEVAAAKELLTESEEQIRNTTDAIGIYDESLEEASEGHEDMDVHLDSTIIRMKDLQMEYSTARESARESVRSQVGYFDELKTKSDYTAKGIIDNWLAQQNAFDNYTANLQKAVDMNLPQELLDQLSDGSEESMLILNALVNDSEVTADQISQAFGERCKAEENLVEQLADMRSSANEEMDALEAEMEQAGSDLVDGAVRGVRKNAYKFDAAMAELGRGGTGKFEEVTLINSPSKLMEDDGEWLVKGSIRGVENLTRDFERTMGALGESGHRAFSEESFSHAMTVPQVLTAGYSAPVSTNTNHYGGFTFQIHQQPGESADALAYRVMDLIQAEIGRKEAAM